MVIRDIAEMVPTPRGLDELAPMDSEELAMRDETDKALGVVRDRRETPRFGFYFHDEGEA